MSGPYVHTMPGANEALANFVAAMSAVAKVWAPIMRSFGWKPGVEITPHWLAHHAKKHHPPVKANRSRVHRRRS